MEECLNFISRLSPTSENVDCCMSRLENVFDVCDELIQAQLTMNTRCVTLIRERATRLHYTWSNQTMISYNSIERETCTGICSTSNHFSSRGRPKVVLNLDQVELLRCSGFSWGEVARCFLITRSTLWRRVNEYGLRFSSYTDISDNDLDCLVSTFRHRHPHSGQAMLQGYLTSAGITIQRERLRTSIRRVDPLT